MLFLSQWGHALPLGQKIDALIQKNLPQADIGILVKDLNTQKIIYQHQANKYFLPASNMKLFTAAAALLSLGPDFRYQTILATDAKQIDDNSLAGDIYLLISGDPSFTSKNLADLFLQLKSDYGIEQIKGNIIVVPPYQLTENYARGIEAEDTQFSYGTKLTPLILDQNYWQLTINPNNQIGQLAKIDYAINSDMVINNQIQTKNSSEHCERKFQISGENQANLTGCIGINDAADMEYLAIPDSFYYLKSQLLEILKANSIKLDGNIILGTSKPQLINLATVQSDRLSQLVDEMLKFSNNLYANAIFFAVAQKIKPSEILSWDQAASNIKQFLEGKLQLDFASAKFSDGAGLSYDNRLSPINIVDLLTKMSQQSAINYEYIEALPVSGGYGSIWRIQQPELKGLVRAKTGTMTGVSALSGFLITKNREKLVFSIIINQGSSDSANNRALENQLLEILYDPQIELSDISIKTPQASSNKINALERALRKKLTDDQTQVIRVPGKITITMPLTAAASKFKLLNEELSKRQSDNLIGKIIIQINSQADQAASIINTINQIRQLYPSILHVQKKESKMIEVQLFF